VPTWKSSKYKLLPNHVDDDAAFFDHEEVGPSAHLIDAEAQQRAKDPFSADLETSGSPSKTKKQTTKTVQFKGLPTSKQSTKNIRLPSILPPPSGSAV